MVIHHIAEYLETAAEALGTQAKLLGDADWLRSEGAQVFAVAQANRILGERLLLYLERFGLGAAPEPGPPVPEVLAPEPGPAPVVTGEVT